MPRDARMDALCAAAATLLDLRDGDQETAEEWDALHRALLAVEEADGPPATLHIEFGALVRQRRGPGGQVQAVRCRMDDLEQVAIAIEEARGEWFVVAEIATRAGRPWMVAMIAVDLLLARGLVKREGVGHRFMQTGAFSVGAAMAELAVAQINATAGA